jgi:Icc-related predicted phosphoesterase
MVLDVAQDARALRTAPVNVACRASGRRGVHMRVFFATDIHGSEVCWRKFLNAAAFYKADLVVLGGDVTGKIMVPVVAHNGYWQAVVRGETIRMETRAELEEVQ